MFSALEADDAQRLEQLLFSSINKFNRRSLRPTVTRDRSAPLLNLDSIAIAQRSIAMDDGTISKHDVPNTVEPAQIMPQVSADDLMRASTVKLDSQSLSDTAVSSSINLDNNNDCYDHPECDYHLRQDFGEDGHRAAENSGTESTDGLE